MNAETQDVAWLTDRLARGERLINKIIRDKRVRHDHAYPMEVGPHHCSGCELETLLRDYLGVPS